MFQFPGFAPRRVIYIAINWVAPFGNLRIEGYLHLPEAYRSLSRLSSALSAKASALCSFLLDLNDAYSFRIPFGFRIFQLSSYRLA